MEAWSKSSLKSLLEGCSWQWALRKIGGLDSPPSPQSAAGTGFHSAVEAHERARIDGVELPTLEQMTAIALSTANDEAALIDFERYGLDEASIEGMIGTALKGWHSDVLPTLHTYTPMLVEPYFKTDFGGSADIHGYIDWFGRDENGDWVVVDYKTASSFSRWPMEMLDETIEAAVYLAGAFHADSIPADENVRMEWHVVKTKGNPSGRIVKGPTFGQELLFFLAERVAEAQQIVDNNAFATKPGWNLCSDKWCPFYHGCQVSGVLAPGNVELYPQS